MPDNLTPEQIAANNAATAQRQVDAQRQRDVDLQGRVDVRTGTNPQSFPNPADEAQRQRDANMRSAGGKPAPVKEDASVIIGRIEGLLNQTRSANPSGAETLHDKLVVEIANLRRSLGK